MVNTTPHIEMPKGYTKGKVPADFVYEYVRELNDPLGILILAIKLLRQDEQKVRDNFEKLYDESKKQTKELANTNSGVGKYEAG
jgi:hypothetical protein